MRTVPDQDSSILEGLLREHLTAAMTSRGTRNTLRMQVLAKAKWWLQDPFNSSYQAAARAIEKHWDVKPNFVCEGGTLRVTPFLEEVALTALCTMLFMACIVIGCVLRS